MTEIRVPTLGESVTEATIGRWFKKAGDAVAVDEPLVELETDKVTIEVPAPSAGTLGEIVAKDGETVAVGALLGQIKEGAAGAAAKLRGPGYKGRSRRYCRSTDGACSDVGQGCPGGRAAGTFRAQDFRRKRDRCRYRSGLRQGWPRNQGRHARGNRKGGAPRRRRSINPPPR